MEDKDEEDGVCSAVGIADILMRGRCFARN
jgi:hypothetical protein